MLTFNRDVHVEFNEEQHKYYVDGNAMNTSVTTLVHQYFKPFDKTRTANLMLRGKNFWNDEKYSSYWDLVRGLKHQDAVDAIVNLWSNGDAALLGTAMHACIEDYYMHGKKPDVLTPELDMFFRFDDYSRELGYEPKKSEQIVYDTDYSLAGSVDMLYIDRETGDYWLVDWKRSKEIKFEGYRGLKALPPIDDKQDCNYEQYSLQLNIYKFLLEKNYGLSICRMSLVILHPNNDDYIIIDVEDNQEAVEVILTDRAKKFGRR